MALSEYQDSPVWEHDCNECIFLGLYLSHDLYYCKKGPGPTLIARWGDEGSEYTSGIQFGVQYKDNLDSPMGEAYRLAIEKGLINQSTN